MSNFSGFGIIPPVRRWETGPRFAKVRTAHTAINTGGSNPLRTPQAIAHAKAQSLFRPTFAIQQPAGYGLSPRANNGSVVAAMGSNGAGLSGLGNMGFGCPPGRPCGQAAPLAGLSGYAQSFGCDSFDAALDTLVEALRRADAAGLVGPDITQAQNRADDETSMWRPWARSAVLPTNCKNKTAELALLINNVNVALSKAQASGASSQPPVSLPPSVLAATAAANQSATDAGKPPEEMSLTAKIALIGGISVAGLIAVAVITGQVAPLLRVAKKVVS